MDNIIAIRREDDNKKAEKRTALTPEHVKELVEKGFKVLVQSGISPQTNEIKRAFLDDEYEKAGATITEDITSAKIIFGIKETNIDKILPNKVYLKFSHTHKGQKKNRKILKLLVENNSTLIDYELITNDKKQRVVTAFTYIAGHAGIVDSLWTLGKRLGQEGIKNPFEKIPQSIEKEHLNLIDDIFKTVGSEIIANGTPKELPPIITCICGTGKTSIGAQGTYDILPVKEIKLSELEDTFKNGSKSFVYKLVLEVYDMYKLKEGLFEKSEYEKLTNQEKIMHYINNPNLYESNLEKVLPYVTVLINCILWSEKYPRIVTKDLIKNVYEKSKTLKVIGDISCDPEGAIEFSKETWIDSPIYIYNPLTMQQIDDVNEEGIAVMAVTNLPCEFSRDSSIAFNKDLRPYIEDILTANYSVKFENSNLPQEIKNGAILWNGKFTPNYKYMKEYIKG